MQPQIWRTWNQKHELDPSLTFGGENGIYLGVDSCLAIFCVLLTLSYLAVDPPLPTTLAFIQVLLPSIDATAAS